MKIQIQIMPEVTAIQNDFHNCYILQILQLTKTNVLIFLSIHLF